MPACGSVAKRSEFGAKHAPRNDNWHFFHSVSTDNNSVHYGEWSIIIMEWPLSMKLGTSGVTAVKV